MRSVLTLPAMDRFRWVALQLDALCDPEYIHCPEDIEEGLCRLPTTLEATSQEILDKFDQYQLTSKSVITEALNLLLCAERTLERDE